ncbi:ferredoxin family protein [Elusimicrobiota bacterium]
MKTTHIDERLGLLTFKNDHQSHIKIKEIETCKAQCKDKPCIVVCPAAVYVWNDEQQKMLIQYENCIECGGCRMICPYLNIDCNWPRGGMGVAYKYG